jgi:very-short-patch-repair endonuclease
MKAILRVFLTLTAVLILSIVAGAASVLLFVVMDVYPPEEYFTTYVLFVIGGGWWFYLSEQKSQEQEARSKQHLRDYETLKSLSVKANAHDPEAMFDLGVMYLSGRGTRPDEKAGMDWIHAAARKHEPRACIKIGYAYLRGEFGYPISNADALTFFEDAARQGDEEARTMARSLRRSETRRKKINVTSNEWQRFAEYFERCDSEAEIWLLEALILGAELKPDGNVLRGKISLQPQALALIYRVDFLVNQKLVVEVDGQSYHSDPRAFEADRLRDQELILNGFQPIRFSAKQIFRDSAQAADKVIEAAYNLTGSSIEKEPKSPPISPQPGSSEREISILKARQKISDRRLIKFLRAIVDDGTIAAISINERLRRGESLDEIFFDGDQFGYQLSVTHLSKSKFRIEFGCQAGPLAGDGGSWEVTFYRNEITSLVGGGSWIS